MIIDLESNIRDSRCDYPARKLRRFKEEIRRELEGIPAERRRIESRLLFAVVRARNRNELSASDY